MTKNKTQILSSFTSNRHLLILTITIIIVSGLSALVTVPRIEDPRITTRNATIITPYPGASATHVESLVTKKIEDQLRELPEIKTIESESRIGISLITIELQDWVGPTDNEAIFSKVRDRLNHMAGKLPKGTVTPEVDSMRGAVAYSMIIALTQSPDMQLELGILKRCAEQLGDKLLNINGTEQVKLFGAPSEEVLVNVQGPNLAALGLTPSDLAKQIASADTRRSSGIVHSSSQNISLEVTGSLDSAARIASIPLVTNGQGGLLSVGDVATVYKQWAEPPEQVSLNGGNRSVLLAVRTEGNIRLDQWSSAAQEKLETFRSNLDPTIQLEVVFNQNSYASERLASLAGNLSAGAAVVVAVILIMMGWRAALIVGSALPLSACITLSGLTFLGNPIHQMTIFGMIIAIGLLIDNAIIMTDQVVSNRRRGYSAVDSVVKAINHLFIPLLASTLTTILGFMPIFLLSGNVGDFVGPIATSVVLALAASFVLSMTIIPALTGQLAYVRQSTTNRWWQEGISSTHMKTNYHNLLLSSLHRPKFTLALTAILPIIGFILASNLGIEFFPPADRNQIEIQVWMPSGTSIEHTVERLNSIDAAVRKLEEVKQITWVAGASSPPVYYNQLRLDEHHPEYARGVIETEDASSTADLEAVLQHELEELFTDAQIVIKAFGQGPPIAAPITFRIVGSSLDHLQNLGEQLRALLYELPEVTTTRASIIADKVKLWFIADEHSARLAGLSLGHIADQFQAALDGSVGGRVLEGLEDIPVKVRYQATERDAINDVINLNLRTSVNNQAWVSASAFGDLRLKPEFANITRYNSERTNNIQAFLRQGNLPIEITRKVQAKLESGVIKLPPGYRIETAGESAEQQKAISQLLNYAPILGLLMISTLVLTFRSFSLAALIGVVALFSVGLGMLSVWLGSYPLGFNPILGTAGLIGVAINASIVVLAAIRANPEAYSGSIYAIVEETVNSTRHIVSTTLTTIAGFIPLLLFSGGNFWPPLAVVIAGGVGLSAVLSLFFTPTAYYLIMRK